MTKSFRDIRVAFHFDLLRLVLVFDFFLFLITTTSLRCILNKFSEGNTGLETLFIPDNLDSEPRGDCEINKNEN